MLVFVCETVTGGGFAGPELPASLIAEGALMRDALIGDLEDLPGVRVVTTHDDRLPPPPRGQSRPVKAGPAAWEMWAELAAEAHCCWPIAPETGGELAALVALMRTVNARVIACDAATLEIGASKLATSQRLAAAGVPVVPTWRAGEVPADHPGPFVVKPDDGAGTLLTFVVATPPRPSFTGGVVQPLVEGEAWSLCALCQGGRSHVLSVNRQNVVRTEDRFMFHGVTVGVEPPDSRLEALTAQIFAALPGLHGLIGIDYIETPKGPVVLEINPRLTTSYVGLHRALAINPLAFVAELIRDGAVPDLPHLPLPRPVEVTL
ncbi:ATP-grasp domain-containing protein [Ancylobacter lacus]|uniref:ATP-grasp domain-containing protein n=1 Tax=Ancylobacter lacus TaxID=2579970 RepID=UPI001BD17182|nr:ATP-grasp domain-containing protein [Ancylobacter lacus]MBS7539426.1 ATP-grasp domain-containing protein [Ancylobacter lacus]